ncbi:FAD-binding protein [Segetibacter sp. 3557_3]|uniref:NAD(P)/FAD-dependent oxidoreductase n=1 Tax=Segetibacter sp. 3557_3 TaxID=2547429 RepID=UPI0010590F29|nr:FAD-dependent oxidoreductase [Segetibacter sp. 3557_3]TDH26118.1 FAD-binding protein [Segetibacter sp. 3557_3]
MQQQVTLRLTPSEALDEQVISSTIAAHLNKAVTDITGYFVVKQSLDARGKQAWVNLTLNVFINEPFQQRTVRKIELQPVHSARHSVVIVGAGPAGLFAALYLIEQGIRPVILERGKDVKARRRDLATLNKAGVVNAESNYCFGEGGAGTYSDGKLYTRSTKRGDVNRILNIFVQYGADEEILYEAHPHIGTNKLPHIITAIRNAIIESGGLFIFEKKVTDLLIDRGSVTSVVTADGDQYPADSVIIATGHSARDIFTFLHAKGILIEAKPFALGVRVEHPQALIDEMQYNRKPTISSPFTAEGLSYKRSEYLPPASYSLVQQVKDKGVFSFCMCPGGIIAPAATNPGELVVNGWSPSKRNNFFANSGMVVTVNQQDLTSLQEYNAYLKHHGSDINSPLSLMYFQQMVEEKAFQTGGGNMVAPAQRMADFSDNKSSSSLPSCSYLPGIHSANLNACLPPFIYKSLQQGFRAFGEKMKGYFTNDALVVATESRTSSPVRIPREQLTLQHPQLKNLYPCGEGAGYAGGIVSAAMDGERVAASICLQLTGKA